MVVYIYYMLTERGVSTSEISDRCFLVRKLYDISLLQTEEARSISSLLCDQISCECSDPFSHSSNIPDGIFQ